MICYHHIDMDGKSAGYLVHTMKPKEIEDTPDSYIPTGYESEFDKHNEKDDVFIVDISISEATYPKLLNVCKTARTVTWIDHHATSKDVIENHIEELQRVPNLTYFVSTSACGAVLTYCYFNLPKNELSKIRKINENQHYSITAEYTPNNEGRATGIVKITLIKESKENKFDYYTYYQEIILPKWLYHIDDYDCWRHNNKQTDYIILGADSKNTSVTLKKKDGTRFFNYFWDQFTSDLHILMKLATEGRNIDSYLSSRYRKEIRSTFEWEFEGIKFLCKNATGNSWNFGNKIEQYPAVILFNYDGRYQSWSYSVYSDQESSFNCKEFCERFGGGGHPHASGFSSKKLIFSDPNFGITKKNIIYLGGTNEQSKFNYRTPFIQDWKTYDSPITKGIELYNPNIMDWNDDNIKENEKIKKTSLLNLFVITPSDIGHKYSIAEAVESAFNGYNTFLAVYDKYCEFNLEDMIEFKHIGHMISEKCGTYCTYIGDNAHLNLLIEDIIDYIK